MTEEELIASEQAYIWIKQNKKLLIQKFDDTEKCEADILPTTLFMAGSPGAGKTEISKRMMTRFKQKPIRIDADEIRSICPGYIGSSAHIFQKAATKGVHILHDYALNKNINIILDGTFAYSDALENIQRSLDHERKVEIFFVYQDTVEAWEFTKKREEMEKRRITKEIFIDAFLKARENINKAKERFGPKIQLNVIIKDYEKDLESLELNVENIDNYLKKRYDRASLEQSLT